MGGACSTYGRRDVSVWQILVEKSGMPRRRGVGNIRRDLVETGDDDVD